MSVKLYLSDESHRLHKFTIEDVISAISNLRHLDLLS